METAPTSGRWQTVWRELRAYVVRVSADDVPGLAAEITYRFMFATFPFLLFLAALSGFLASATGVADPVGQVIGLMGRTLPADLAGPVRRFLASVLLHREPELLSVGAVLTLYSAAGAVGSLMKAMNRAMGLTETRSILRRIGLAVALTFLGGLAVLVAVVAVVGGMLATQQLIEHVGLGRIWPVVSLLRWPLVFLLLVGAGAAVLRLAPSVRPPWRWCIAAAAVAATGWLVVTFGLGIYVARSAGFDSTYGVLAAVIVLMFWYYLSAMALLLAVELMVTLAGVYRTDYLHPLVPPR